MSDNPTDERILAAIDKILKENKTRREPREGGAPSARFERFARRVMSKYFGVELYKKEPRGVPKEFDMVSWNESIIGDAKYLKNIPTPAAKFSGIAEYVWLLEKTKAKKKFLAFGRDIEMPQRWLNKYRGLLPMNIQFFFIHNEGQVEELS